VTLVDDGTNPAQARSLNVDDEGNLTQAPPYRGRILNGYMQHMMTPADGHAHHGNARRESFAQLNMPRMTNSLMLGGDKNPADIIAR